MNSNRDGVLLIHYDNQAGFETPVLLVAYEDEEEEPTEISTGHSDDYGMIFELPIKTQQSLLFKFKDEEGEEGEAVEDDSLWRAIDVSHLKTVDEIWCRASHPFVFTKKPQLIQEKSAADFVDQQSFKEGVFVSDTPERFGLGATEVDGEGVLFGFFHPHAARVYVTGDFNDWHHPGSDSPDPDQFLEMDLFPGYFGAPNIWLKKVDGAQSGQTYKFFVEFNALNGEGVVDGQLVVDPYARFLGDDFERNDALIVDPSEYKWEDSAYQTPPIHDLIIYELHVHGFTHDHPDIKDEHQGRFQGVIDRIESGYFDQIGVTCLYLMPIAEVPTPQGEESLGYNSSLFMAVERDFGTPDELRRLVDTAHQHGLAVIIDQVFNHSANSWNPLWKLILDHPAEWEADEEGGLYFSGSSPWGNRISTERTETQNMLIDACKMMVAEYHLDGFRFDATHSNYLDHELLHRLADELQSFKPDVILIAENLPNESDLNRNGYDGFAQWCDPFHDGIKALLREGPFEGTEVSTNTFGELFYFSKDRFAAHTNNVVNYCESHDEHSVAHEVSFVEDLDTPEGKERKARLGLFSTMVALGQPMIYMGQEFGVERPRNRVYFDFPEDLEHHHFFQWAARLINLRRRTAGLKIYGYNPLEEGRFEWVIGPWMAENKGHDKRVIGWRTIPNDQPEDQIVVLLNFENHPIEADVDFGLPGAWVRLATIDTVVDEITADETTLHLADGICEGFVLPDSSAFIYRWHGESL